jgi:hypothetical protein
MLLPTAITMNNIVCRKFTPVEFNRQVPTSRRKAAASIFRVEEILL